MDSDSDSGGSHISATPPRDHKSPLRRFPDPVPPPPPSARPALLTSTKSRIKIRAAATTSRPILLPKRRAKPSKSNPNVKPSSPQRDSLPVPIPPPNLSDLPFQILRPSQDNGSLSSNTNSTETLPAGRPCLSSFASFSKIRRSSLNFEPIDNDPVPSSLPITQEKENHEVKSQPKIEIETSTSSKLGKIEKRHPNLIGNNGSSSLPVKKPKYTNEGNFVKLNINGHGRKFAYKSKKKNYNAYNGRRYYKRSKGKPKTRVEGDNNGLCDEEAIDFDTLHRESGESEYHDMGLIDEAVSLVRSEASDENLVSLLKLSHGYDSFRHGQLEAIRAVLSGKSTMLVLPTGAGKSLCYQLPAIVLPGITLVVSPLVALMIDQLKQLPPMIHGGLLSSSQTLEETSKTLMQLREGRIKVLFVSPERFLNAEFTSIFSSNLLISLLVIDEAHCISEWSHNFRPSYMRLRAGLLRSKLNVECFLAMTATATTKTLNDVMSALEIAPMNLIRGTQMRENMQLSVSMSGNRMKDLILLLKSVPFKDLRSIIIYCKFQSETDLISKYLCDNNISAKSYHSGIPAKDRNRTQEQFCSNKIRVVVATVAFGMGLDKRDIGAVIHYSLPESLEEYVQEIGRAGRDGRLSYCHLLFDDSTYFKLRSLMYSDGVEEYTINRFLGQVFCNESDSPGQIRCLIKESASRKSDMKEEVMLTILTHLELGEFQYLRLLPQTHMTCTLNFHQTTPVMLAAKDIVVAAILKKSEMKHGQYVFDIPTVANSIGIQAIDLSNRLQTLKLRGEVTYELKDPAYCYTTLEVPKDFCSLSAHLTNWLSEVENCKVRKIDAMFHAAVFAAKSCDKKNGCSDSQHTPCLNEKILEYFNGDDGCEIPNTLMSQSSRFLRADIKVFLQSNSQAKFTPRAIARIMHGIASPAFPSMTWAKTHFWGRYMHVDFKVVMEAAKAELLNFVGKDLLL